MKIPGLIIVSTLVLSASAHAEVTVLEDRIIWYAISGNSLEELRKSMEANTPAKGFDAETKWWVDWRFGWSDDGKDCSLNSQVVMLRVETNFPRIAIEGGMPPEVLQKWRNYSARLMAHERTHARNGANAADEIYNALKTFSAAGTCEDIEDKANEAALKLIRRANNADEDYDRRTNHGATEGAVLE